MEAASRTAKKKQVGASVKQAASYLGNTPTVARSSYIDPRVIDAFEEGQPGGGRPGRRRAGGTEAAQRRLNVIGSSSNVARAARSVSVSRRGLPEAASTMTIELIARAHTPCGPFTS